MPFEGTGSQTDLTGQILAGRYRIVAKLGEGAMGAVYVGEHLRIGRRDAIKVLRDGIARDTEATARFVRGARNVSAIRHPNVCTIYDFSDTADGLQFLAMEYVDGETLKDTLDRVGRLDLNRAADIAGQVADALQAAHDVGIVHRDLKPANVMLGRSADGSDLVKVVDFDIAKGPSDDDGAEVTRLGFVIGTPEYMSPEQLTGDRLDGRSDVYSLAIVLFRMLTGSLPFIGETAQDMMVERLTTDATRLNTVSAGSFPAELDDLIARSLARKRDARPASAAAFARELRQIAGMPRPSIRRVAEVPATIVFPTSGREASATRSKDDTPAAVGSNPVSWRRPRLLAAAAGLVVLTAFAAFGVPRLLDRNAVNPQDTIPSAAGNLVDETKNTGTPPASAQAESAQQVAPPQTTTPPHTAESLAEALDRLSKKVATPGLPDPDLRAVYDTVATALLSARTRPDSASAVAILAQVAALLEWNERCAQWIRVALSIGETSVQRLQEICH